MADTMTTPQAERGTAASLMEFLDFASTRGDMNTNTANAYKAACREILSATEGAEWEAVTVADLDLDDVCRRFERLRAMKFQPDSLVTYQRRFRSSVSMYTEWLENPGGWKPPKNRTTAKARDGAGRTTGGGGGTTTTSPPVTPTPSAPGMITYPFPLRQGVLANVQLPPDLTKREAKRLAIFIESLAVEEQLALPVGDPLTPTE